MPHKKIAIIAGFFFTIIWSGAFLVARDAVSVLSPIGLVSLRLFLAGILLFAIYRRSVLRFWKDINTSTKLYVLFSGIFAHGIYLGSNFWALEVVPTSTTNVITSSLPIVTIPLAYFLLGERIRLWNVFAVTLGLLGVFVTVHSSNTNEGTNLLDSHLMAAGLVVFSVLSLAAGNVLAKTFINHQNFLQVCTIQFLSSGIFLLPFSLILEEPLQLDTLFADYLLHLVYMVCIASILGTVLWFQVLNTYSANAASSFFLLTPIMGIVFGFIFFAEPITEGRIAGAAIITISIAVKVFAYLQPKSWRTLNEKLKGNPHKR